MPRVAALVLLGGTRGEGAEELGLLVGRLEATVAKLGRRVDELEGDLLLQTDNQTRISSSRA